MESGRLGTHERIRTSDLPLRRRPLYPAELRGQINIALVFYLSRRKLSRVFSAPTGDAHARREASTDASAVSLHPVKERAKSLSLEGADEVASRPAIAIDKQSPGRAI